MTSEVFSALFITYDGLLDPLGGSQILPYLRTIASHPRPLHVVSFEKHDRFAEGAKQMRSDLATVGIRWTPLSFTASLGKFGKVWDLLRMYGACLLLQRRYRFKVIHCRSYQAMQVGCLLRRVFGVLTIFDMRGLWVDERVDGGLWPQGSWVNRLAYRTYKSIERRLLCCASHVVALTDAVVPELKRLSPEMTAPVTVIPCCADFDHFVSPPGEARLVLRRELGIPANTLVLSYLGSLGTWYMLDEMLKFFAVAARRCDDVNLLLITRDWRAEHENLVSAMGLQKLRGRIHVRAANRDEVPGLLGASDIMLSFIKPAYSKMASSPTKLAEAFALGIPVISNSGVGDVEQITRDLDAGAVIDLNTLDVFDKLADDLEEIRTKGGADLRARACKHYGLEVAAQTYRRIYAELEGRQ